MTARGKLKMENDFLDVKINLKKGRLSVRDKRGKKTWLCPGFPAVKYWDVIQERIGESIFGRGKELLVENLSTGKDAVILAFKHTLLGLKFQMDIRLSGNVLEVSLPIKKVSESSAPFALLNIQPLPRFGLVRNNPDGYLLLPNYSGVICRLNKKQSMEHRNLVYGRMREWEDQVNMPVFGVARQNSAFLGIITSGEFDTELITEVAQGPEKLNAVYPCFHYRYGKAGVIDRVDRTVKYHFLAGVKANYAGMACAYQEYLLKEKGLKPLRKKIQKSPSLEYSYNAYNDLRISCGKKKGKVARFSQVREIMTGLKKAGITKAVLMLVGCTNKGPDAGYPTKLPLRSGLGGNREFSKLAGYAKSQNYQLINWDNYSEFYPDSPDWNAAHIVRDQDGWLVKGNIWAGGPSYIGCPHEMLKFAGRDMPRMKKLGFRGTWYIDAMPPPLRTCYAGNHHHPPTRRAYAEGLKKITRRAQKVFGACTVECAMDYLADSIDGVANICAAKFRYLKNIAFCKNFADELVPFYQIAYHGIIQYHLWQPYKYKKAFGSIRNGFLKEIEYGAMPRNEFGYKYYKKWLPLMKSQYEVICSDLGALQLEFIENHRKITPEVTETTYSDGTRVIINYGKSPCVFNGRTIKPKWYLKEGGVL